eukprot:867223-Pelagomonas_calceolata.AAC.9
MELDLQPSLAFHASRKYVNSQLKPCSGTLLSGIASSVYTWVFQGAGAVTQLLGLLCLVQSRAHTCIIKAKHPLIIPQRCIHSPLSHLCVPGSWCRDPASWSPMPCAEQSTHVHNKS